MRKLILMQGPICSGKSTWIQKNNLEKYSISIPQIKLLTSCDSDTAIWEIIEKILEKRLANGEFTIINDENYSFKLINRYKELAEKYNYSVYVVRMPIVDSDVLLSRVHERNKTNKIIVSDEKVISSVNHMFNQEIPNWVKLLDCDEALDAIKYKIVPFDKYNGLLVIGGIHSNYQVLLHAWNKLNVDKKLAENWLVAVTGDLFDYGCRPSETFNFLNNKINEWENFKIVLGDHDLNLYNYAFNTPILAPHDDINLFKGTEVTKKRLRIFLRKTYDCLFLQKDNTLISITHGGFIDYPDNFELIPSTTFIKGFDKSIKFDDEASQKEGLITIHGNKNYNHNDVITMNKGLSVNLEQNDYTRNNLSIFMLYPKLTFEVKSFKNTEFNITEKDRIELLKKSINESFSIPEVVVDHAKRAKYIPINNFEDIYAIKYLFNPILSKDGTLIQQNLFINTTTNKVIARGHNVKFINNHFYNINDNGPYFVFKNYPGFLGLLTFDTVNNRFIVLPGSNFYSQEDYKIFTYSKNMILGMINQNNITYLSELLSDKTALFRVNFKKRYEQIHLLDIINNELTFDSVSSFSYSELNKIVKDLDFPFKKLLGIIHNVNSNNELKFFKNPKFEVTDKNQIVIRIS